MSERPPRILIIDDLFGRSVAEGRNRERSDLCGQLLLRDITEDATGKAAPKVRNAVAEAVFVRGQRPTVAAVGDTVENDLSSVLAAVRRGWDSTDLAERWSLVLLDLSFKTGLVTSESDARVRGFPEGRPEDDGPQSYFGLQVLDHITREFPDLPVLILSAQERSEVSRSFAERGALGFIDRADATPDALRARIRHDGLIADDSGVIVGRSRALLLALRRARRVASRTAEGARNILLRGERGTGKELFAEFIHANTPNIAAGTRPFEAVDCGTLTAELFLSELFGHTRGAFTGATAPRFGRVLQADGGDLFLDEIGNLPAQAQAGLLRFLQERVVVPMGSETGRQVDVRVLSATNVDIESAAGSFRADLLDRLREGGNTIVLPPLRERREDIPLLVERFVRESEARVKGALRRSVTEDALRALQQYEWPGNVRELRSVVTEAVNAHPDVEHLVARHLAVPAAPQTTAAPKTPKASEKNSEDIAEAPAVSVVDVIRTMDSARFDPTRAELISGQLPVIHASYARMIARYFAAALHATKKVKPGNPSGDPAFQPAMKLATGDPSLKGTKAADIVKKFLSLSPDDISTELLDPLLQRALEKAKGTRRRKTAQDAPPAEPD